MLGSFATGKLVDTMSLSTFIANFVYKCLSFMVSTNIVHSYIYSKMNEVIATSEW